MEEPLLEKLEEQEKPFKEKHADWFLATLAFAEASFLPIIIDPFIVAVTLARPKSWVRYTLIAGTASVIGGLFGYFVGAVFFELIGAKLVAFYHLEGLFAKAVASANQGAFWFTLLGALTPIPYKLIAIVGGTLHINIVMFVLASIVGRFGRFVVVAYICHKFGEYALSRFTTRFNVTILAVCSATILYFIILYLKS